MPTFTKIAWETLLEPTLHKNPSNPPPSVINTGSNDYDENANKKRPQKTPNHIYISPALYITPAPAPIPTSSSDPVSPSPYVVNHKRRGRDVVVRAREGEIESNSDLGLDLSSSGDCDDEVVVGEVVEVEEKLFGVGGEDRNGTNGGCDEVVEDDFLDPRCDAVSVGSLTEVEEFGKQVSECRSVVSNQGEFFDADEDFSSDGSMSNLSSSYGPRIESELRAARFSLLEEIERRKTAEHAVAQMYSQWQRLASLLSQTGLTFPTATPPDATSMQLEIDCLEQCCQELEVTRFVAEAIGRDQALAEAEIAAELIIESKDLEISRLRDKLQYYEAVNHEMSQRNQEVMEVARRQRQRRKNQRKWTWGCIGLSVAIGTSVIAYSYLPHALPTSGDSSDASCISLAESA